MTPAVIIFLLVLGCFDPTLALLLFCAHMIYLAKKKDA